jgi:hypothetical protein
MQTLDAMVFPFRDPCRHGDAMHLIGIGNGLDGCVGGTQQQTVGAAPRSEGGILLHRFFLIPSDLALVQFDGNGFAF